MSRRNHRERAQPLNRQKLGLLEKHKDYVHRARDYKSKKDRIKKLREKAAFRNKDEFYWGMVKGQTKGGVAIADRGNEALSTDMVRLLKTQDVGYIKVQIAQDEKVSTGSPGLADSRKSPSFEQSYRLPRPLAAALSGMLPRSLLRSRSWPRWA